ENSSAAAARQARGLKVDYGFIATMGREIRRDPKREVGYGITDSWDEKVETLQGAPVSTDTDLGGYMREFETRDRRDTNEIYSRLDDEQKIRELHAADHRKQIVTSEMLRADHRRFVEIRGLRTADRTRQQQLIQTLTVMKSLQRQVTSLQGQAMIGQGVTATFAAHDALRNTNRNDSHNSRMGVRRTERATHECTYTDFLKCQPLHFKDTEGVAGLSQWLERMKYVFHISNYAVENQVKFATCTLHSVASTWWNTHVKTVGHDAAYGMPWKTLMKMMTDKYCPQNDIKKLEIEIWDLKVKGYTRGLLDMIHGSVVASKPKTMQEAVEIATKLMDKKIRTFAERKTESKREFENTSRSTQNQQQQSNKRQNTDRVYTAASGEKK
nr:hypothetical protein [Tanacetum cinerariifolium]